MGKRAADVDPYDLKQGRGGGDEEAPTGEMQQASAEVMATRKIFKLKRNPGATTAAALQPAAGKPAPMPSFNLLAGAAKTSSGTPTAAATTSDNKDKDSEPVAKKTKTDGDAAITPTTPATTTTTAAATTAASGTTAPSEEAAGAATSAFRPGPQGEGTAADNVGAVDGTTAVPDTDGDTSMAEVKEEGAADTTTTTTATTAGAASAVDIPVVTPAPPPPKPTHNLYDEDGNCIWCPTFGTWPPTSSSDSSSTTYSSSSSSAAQQGRRRRSTSHHSYSSPVKHRSPVRARRGARSRDRDSERRKRKRGAAGGARRHRDSGKVKGKGSGRPRGRPRKHPAGDSTVPASDGKPRAQGQGQGRGSRGTMDVDVDVSNDAAIAAALAGVPYHPPSNGTGSGKGRPRREGTSIRLQVPTRGADGNGEGLSSLMPTISVLVNKGPADTIPVVEADDPVNTSTTAGSSGAGPGNGNDNGQAGATTVAGKPLVALPPPNVGDRELGKKGAPSTHPVTRSDYAGKGSELKVHVKLMTASGSGGGDKKGAISGKVTSHLGSARGPLSPSHKSPARLSLKGMLVAKEQVGECSGRRITLSTAVTESACLESSSGDHHDCTTPGGVSASTPAPKSKGSGKRRRQRIIDLGLQPARGADPSDAVSPSAGRPRAPGYAKRSLADASSTPVPQGVASTGNSGRSTRASRSAQRDSVTATSGMDGDEDGPRKTPRTATRSSPSTSARRRGSGLGSEGPPSAARRSARRKVDIGK
eukprot:TRINITY_DN10505_c0_g1_i3.p1 TRINITY_DN10505_c0_g1~~TRINITY_DN10505_c0_g1_i3.p1  ORF type:complete len:758 (-),score=190.14 TRINITY_DN10505_c0_g1_i3:8-2281(-)